MRRFLFGVAASALAVISLAWSTTPAQAAHWGHGWHRGGIHVWRGHYPANRWYAGWRAPSRAYYYATPYYVPYYNYYYPVPYYSGSITLGSPYLGFSYGY
jgi:hypothetical protein